MGKSMYKEVHELQIDDLDESYDLGSFNMLYAHHTMILRWKNSSEVIE